MVRSGKMSAKAATAPKIRMPAVNVMARAYPSVMLEPASPTIQPVSALETSADAALPE